MEKLVNDMREVKKLLKELCNYNAIQIQIDKQILSLLQKLNRKEEIDGDNW